MPRVITICVCNGKLFRCRKLSKLVVDKNYNNFDFLLFFIRRQITKILRIVFLKTVIVMNCLQVPVNSVNQFAYFKTNFYRFLFAVVRENERQRTLNWKNLRRQAQTTASRTRYNSSRSVSCKRLPCNHWENQQCQCAQVHKVCHQQSHHWSGMLSLKIRRFFMFICVCKTV